MIETLQKLGQNRQIGDWSVRPNIYRIHVLFLQPRCDVCKLEHLWNCGHCHIITGRSSLRQTSAAASARRQERSSCPAISEWQQQPRRQLRIETRSLGAVVNLGCTTASTLSMKLLERNNADGVTDERAASPNSWSNYTKQELCLHLSLL